MHRVIPVTSGFYRPIANIITRAASSGKKLTPQEIFERESKYGCHNYHPLPVALCKGKGYNLE